MMDDLTAEREEIQRVGDSFAALRESSAWKFMWDWLAAECERAKGKAILAAADAPTKEVRNLMIAWQEREKIAIGLSSLIDEQIEKRDSIAEEMRDERAGSSPGSSDPTASW